MKNEDSTCLLQIGKGWRRRTRVSNSNCTCIYFSASNSVNQSIPLQLTRPKRCSRRNNDHRTSALSRSERNTSINISIERLNYGIPVLTRVHYVNQSLPFLHLNTGNENTLTVTCQYNCSAVWKLWCLDSWRANETLYNQYTQSPTQ